MHVLYFHQHFSVPSGSTGSRSYAFARALVAKGHGVTMVCGKYEGSKTGLSGPFDKNIRRGTTDGIDIIEISVPYSNKMSIARRALQFAKFALVASRLALGEKHDLLFATSTPLTIGIPAIVGRLLRRKPMVFEVRDLWPELPKAMGVITNPIILSAMSALEWSSYHAADHCIGLSPGMVEGIKSRGIRVRRISMVPNGCDLELFERTGKTRSELGFPRAILPDDFVAVFTGAHGMANGLDAVINAARELKKRRNDRIKFLLIGDGMLKPGLQKQALEEGLDNVVFMDPVPKTRLIELLGGIDLGLMLLKNVEAFYYGTSPNKFFDYLSASKPVLVNYPGWMSDLVNEHEIGFAIAPDDEIAFADALERAANDEGLEDKARRARQLGEAQFDRADLAEQFIAVLEKTARAKGVL